MPTRRPRLPSSLLAGLLLAGISPSPARAEDPPPLVPLEAFVEPQPVRQVLLSPAGDRIAYWLHGERRQDSIWTLDPSTGERRRRLDSRLIGGLHWSTSGRGLFVEARERLAYLPVEDGRATLVVRLDADREQRFVQVDPTRPDHVLLHERGEDGGYRLLRVSVDGDQELVFEDEEPIRRFWLGDDGKLELLQSAAGLEMVIRLVAGGERREIYRCGFRDACGIEAFDSAARRLWLRKRLDGGRWGLVVVDLDKGVETVVHQDPRGLADLAEVVADPASREPLLAVHDTEKRRTYALDPDLSADIQRLQQRFPDSDLHIQARRGAPHWLVVEGGSAVFPYRHYVYAAESGELRQILEEESASGTTVPTTTLAAKRHLRYRASDGMWVYGFVTLPPGTDAASAPLVALVHGGPWNHVSSGLERGVLFLANRGYVVFQPNFRGSTGYGLDYTLAAQGDFGDGRVHRDIVEGVTHLLEQGIGDPERVAIAGHSFGGFSALGGVAFSPDLFKAGIASAPAIDLVRALRDFEEDTRIFQGLPIKPLFAELLVDLDDAEAVEALRRQSPEKRVADTARPLLILAGGRDEKVDIVDVRSHAAALVGLGKDVSLWVDDELGHSFSTPRARMALLYLQERFLGHHLGGRVGPFDDPAVEGYLRSNLRHLGEGLAAALGPADAEGPES